MDAQIPRNQQYLRDLFAGPFRGHAICMHPEPLGPSVHPDLTVSQRLMREWVDDAQREYENQLQWLEILDDDSVPYVKTHTGTGLFAAAFGCDLHVPEDSQVCARPLVSTPAQADALAQPDLSAPTLSRALDFASAVRDRMGPYVPVSVPDIQSAFDIAALVWNKQDLYMAVYDAPESVQRLVAKCQRLLKMFFDEFLRRLPNGNLCHCPRAWAPPELGVWLSEDEAGAMSVPMFEQFCLPTLVDLSETYGGLFMHCCADADHQYGNFKKIPNLRGLNRVFQDSGPGRAIEVFGGSTVLVQAWMSEHFARQMLEMAGPDCRFLFDFGPMSLEEARPLYERMRELCPRGALGA